MILKVKLMMIFLKLIIYSEYIKNFVTARKDRILNSDIIKKIL